MQKAQLPKIIAVVGPTATGKSDLGVVLARKFNGEIISADSRQVYKGMNIGTGKITKREMRGVPHHLLDVASAKSGNYNVNKFKKAAEKTISAILNRGKLPILVGGTGFWIEAVAKNQEFHDVRPNPILRTKLEKVSVPKLFAMLKKIDPKRAASIDPNNKRRIIRAIEIAKELKRSSTELPTPQPKYQTLFIGLDMSDEQLRKKINERLDKRLKGGMVKEIKKLRRQGVSWKKLDDFGLEYRFVAAYLQRKINPKEMREQLATAIWQYAKRQRTWFKRNEKINWFDPTKKQFLTKGIALVKKYLG